MDLYPPVRALSAHVCKIEELGRAHRILQPHAFGIFDLEPSYVLMRLGCVPDEYLPMRGEPVVGAARVTTRKSNPEMEIFFDYLIENQLVWPLGGGTEEAVRTRALNDPLYKFAFGPGRVKQFTWSSSSSCYDLLTSAIYVGAESQESTTHARAAFDITLYRLVARLCGATSTYFAEYYRAGEAEGPAFGFPITMKQMYHPPPRFSSMERVIPSSEHAFMRGDTGVVPDVTAAYWHRGESIYATAKHLWIFQRDTKFVNYTGVRPSTIYHHWVWGAIAWYTWEHYMRGLVIRNVRKSPEIRRALSMFEHLYVSAFPSVDLLPVRLMTYQDLQKEPSILS